PGPAAPGPAAPGPEGPGPGARPGWRAGLPTRESVRDGALTAWHALGQATRWLVRTWRRSLQLRVVTTTVLLGLVVVTLLGSYLYTQIARGLQDARISAGQYEALALTGQAQGAWDNTTATSVDALNLAANDIMERYLKPPGPEPTRYVVMSRSLDNTSATVLATLESGPLGLASVTRDLREVVARDSSRQQTQIGQVLLDGRRVPTVMVGTVVEVPGAGDYDLYFLYPMTEEQETMALVSNASAVAGLILTALVGAVAWVVTRQVVLPVRRAAGVAERLSSGRLDERMPIRGEDDLALLGTSFNAMADSLQAQIRQLEGLSRVQHRFVSDVSHELRTPLTTIRMAVDLIHSSREEFAPSVARSAELLAGELDRFEELLADLLEISRFDAGAAALDVEPVDVRTSVAKVVQGARPLAERRGCAVEVVAGADPAEAEVDERRVERILRNLVVNAVEHSEGRPVRVTVGAGEDAVAVVVEDQGVGLKPGQSSLVFNRFWRADPARARSTGGTGLGLAIALEDARLHNGWLQAWGEPGVGSRFRLTLPRAAGGTISRSPLPLSGEPLR
ncbi:MAG TPA: MtrAB system histidine kinase MtrB, partial [Dermatophilaceae bacterium]|nr:MtrAB system histidine kinase MtrB [Dermatophilaceae bacterium]